MCSYKWGYLGLRVEVISRITIITAHIRGLITLLITTHAPPSIGPESPRYRYCSVIEKYDAGQAWFRGLGVSGVGHGLEDHGTE